jgi:branched-chain amino acid transport system permease protein
VRRAFLRWWRELPDLYRRAIIAGLVALVILAVMSFSGAGFVVALVFVLLYLLPYDRFPLGRFILPLVLLGLAVAYPYYRDHLHSLQIIGEFPSMNTATIMVVFAIMAVGLNFVVGYAGLLDLGYVAFYAMGAYTAGWFASPQFASHNFTFGAVGNAPGVPGFHISIWLVLVIAGIFTAVIGVLIGLPTLRLRGDYLAIVTLGFGEIMPQIARNGDNLFGTGFNLTSGPQGITPIDPPGFGSWINRHASFLPDNYVTATNYDRLFFWTALGLLLVTVFCSLRLRDSRLGRAWVAIREDEVAAAAMGIPLMRTKTWSYATGAFFGGVAGAYYASFKSATFPDDFFFSISIFILCMVILGGIGNVWGVIFGAFFLAYLDNEGIGNIGGWLNDRFASGFEVWGSPIDIAKYSFGIYGVIILIVMLFRPQGLIPSSRRQAEFEEGLHDEPLYDATA